MQKIEVIDSHTGGEPTRIIVTGGPDLGDGPLSDRRDLFASKFDDYRSAVVNEPRGSDVVVGGILCQPTDASCVAGVIFFNNTGYLGMCGHGTIGLMVTLKHLGKIDSGRHRIETPVGIVSAELGSDGKVTVDNVPSYRFAKDIAVDVPDYGSVVGDIAWGGNWFFLVKETCEDLDADVDHLTRVTLNIRQALADQAITGANHEVIDHIELFGPPRDASNHSRNFVLCPGGAYDRSPCGTGTSAKLACLAADEKLAPGEEWRQESIVGSVFRCTYAPSPDATDRILPTIRGNAYVCAQTTLILDPADPFCMGIRN